MYRYVFFDLDGTITDSGEGITNSAAYALEKFGIHVRDRSELYPFIGPPIVEAFKNLFHFSREDSVKAVAYYREYYKDKGIFENRVYDGIPELLSALKEKGVTVVLATSKPELYARRILEHFQLDRYFDFITGATMDESRVKKADVIAYALEKLSVRDTSEVLMVGDREHDVIGAGKNRIVTASVLFGYGSEKELTDAGAKYLLKEPKDLLPIVLPGDFA